MFGIPAPTEFDVRFRLFGIPVRIHPLFWLLAGLLGRGLSEPRLLIVWILCVFLSILVHEFGHAFTNRLFGSEPSVYLTMFGGLCAADPSRQRPWQRFLVILMGPGAGFLLMGAAILVKIFILTRPTSGLDAIMRADVGATDYVAEAVNFLIWINLVWGILNLFPIMPLDGGQLTGILLSWHDRRHGLRRAYIVSIVTSGLLAIYCVRRQDYMNAILLGYLALTSYQVLQAYHYKSKYGDSFEDESEADWWKR